MSYAEWYRIALKISISEMKISISENLGMYELMQRFNCHLGEIHDGYVVSMVFNSEEHYNWFLLHQ